MCQLEDKTRSALSGIFDCLFCYFLEKYSCFCRNNEDDSDELSDRDVNKLLIVTQATRPPKHDGYDRTGDWTTRVKMTQDLEQAINDGLYYYEEDLWHDLDFVSVNNVTLKNRSH